MNSKRKIKNSILLPICIIGILIFPRNAFPKSYNEFLIDFKSTLKKDFTSEEFNAFYKKYSNLLQGFIRKEDGSIQYPIEKFKNTEVYKQYINLLFNSTNENHRILAYSILAATNDSNLNNLLLERMKNENTEGTRFQSGWALLVVGDSHTDELFDFIVKYEHFGDPHMMPFFFALDINLLRETAYKKIKNKGIKSKILALSILANSGLNNKTKKIVIRELKELPLESKGWAINALRSLHVGNLLPLLKPLLDENETREVSILALINSPTFEDYNYIITSTKEMSIIDKEMLDALSKSLNPPVISYWLSILPTDKIPGDYSFVYLDNPLLKSELISEQLKDEVIRALYKIKNADIVSTLLESLSRKNDRKTTETIIHFLKHPNPNIRSSVARAAKGNRSKALRDILPELIKNPQYRSYSLPYLLIDNKISNLHDLFESIYRNKKQLKINKDMRSSAIKYILHFATNKQIPLLKEMLLSPEVDWFNRGDVAKALGKLGDMDSVDLIIEVIKNNKSNYNMIRLLEALAMLPCKKSKEMIQSFTTVDDEIHAEFAHELLKNWNEKK